MAGIARRISFKVVLMFGLGFPKIARGPDTSTVETMSANAQIFIGFAMADMIEILRPLRL